MGKLKILILSLGILTTTFACQSQGSLARNKVGKFCSDLSIPEGAKVHDSDVTFAKGKYFVLFDRYSSLAVHAGMLAECGQTLACAIRWTEWERDCKDETNTFWYRFTGFRPQCKILAPDC